MGDAYARVYRQLVRSEELFGVLGADEAGGGDTT
jgi:hypothetical protein